jgi:hypothetical protein
MGKIASHRMTYRSHILRITPRGETVKGIPRCDALHVRTIGIHRVNIKVQIEKR